MFHFLHIVVKEDRRIRQNCVNPILEPALRGSSLGDTTIVDFGLRVLLPGTGLIDGKVKNVIDAIGIMLQQIHCFMWNGEQGKWDHTKELPFFPVSLRGLMERSHITLRCKKLLTVVNLWPELQNKITQLALRPRGHFLLHFLCLTASFNQLCRHTR